VVMFVVNVKYGTNYWIVGSGNPLTGISVRRWFCIALKAGRSCCKNILDVLSNVVEHVCQNRFGKVEIR
jgi:hypothetical protein